MGCRLRIYRGIYCEKDSDLLVEVLELRHEAHALTTLVVRCSFARLVALEDSSGAAVLDVLSQHSQDFRVLPSLGNRAVGRLEKSNSLCPLTSTSRANRLVFGRLTLSYRSSLVRTASFGVLQGSRSRLLGSPVVDIPVILIEEKIVLLELLR